MSKPQQPLPERRTGRDRRSANRAVRRIVLSLIVAYFALVVMFLFTVKSVKDASDAKTNAVAARATATAEREARQAEKRAGIQATFQACKRSIPTLKNVNAFVDAQKGLAQDVLQNAIDNHRATPRGSPLWKTQEGNIRRLKMRRDATVRVSFPTPTVADCREERDRDLAELRDGPPPVRRGP